MKIEVKISLFVLVRNFEASVASKEIADEFGFHQFEKVDHVFGEFLEGMLGGLLLPLLRRLLLMLLLSRCRRCRETDAGG